jgi:hypothetical protein
MAKRRERGIGSYLGLEKEEAVDGSHGLDDERCGYEAAQYLAGEDVFHLR